MREFIPFVLEVESIASRQSVTLTISDPAVVDDVLNAGAYLALRKLVSRKALRENGTFFTSAAMAESIWEHGLNDLDDTSVIVDPACGAGDLLIPPIRHLVRNGKDKELSQRVRASDVEESFADATRYRLQLASLVESRGANTEAFVNIRRLDFLDSPREILEGATHVVMNPPFTKMEAAASCQWGRRKVNTAAIFVDMCLRFMDDGARLIAILPDVLRSGSRYEDWREYVSNASQDMRIKPLGQFDQQTDVHVFLLDLKKGASMGGDDRRRHHISWYGSEWENAMVKSRVLDRFDVSVGSVVPHRHRQVGPTVPFVTAKNLPSWTIVDRVDGMRQYAGRLDRSPLVVIRRTSRPGEHYRARATVISDPRPVAIENHLIVLRPRDGTQAACECLMEMLKLDSTNQFLDARIRCRHLTVAAIRDLPWIDVDPRLT